LAPVLVLTHALGANHTMWDPNIAALSRDFRVLRYDSRGHGLSQMEPGPYTVERLARDVVELLDALGVVRASYCGLSLGGMVGMWLGANAADRIDRLVLANTTAHLAAPEGMNARIEAVRWNGMRAVTDTMLERWFTPHFRSSEPAAADRVRKMLLATPPAGYIAACQAVRDMDMRPLLARIKVPTLVIAGTQDPATPIDYGRYLRDQIAGSRWVELAAAHVSNIEAAAEFDAAVLKFLKEPS
jgi:3-oxoadipate enol-lactonase